VNDCGICAAASSGTHFVVSQLTRVSTLECLEAIS
jgi:hypothetical protein